MLKRRLRFIIMSLFSCIMVVFCHNDGTALPSLWQCSANTMAVQCQASKKFGTNGILLTGVLGRKNYSSSLYHEAYMW